jgi:hypothetical protein
LRYGLRVRVGILDIVAVTALGLATLMPSPSRPIKPLYVGDATALGSALGEAQAEVAARPESGRAAARLADLLTRARQTDWAIRAATAAAAGRSPDRWRALVAASAAHVDRLEIGAGLQWAEKALAACEAPGAACAEHERVRLAVYEGALRAGLESHIDPRRNAKGFSDAVNRATPLIRIDR